MVVGLIFAMSIPVLIVSALYITGFWLIFSKLGEPGWKALIPIYNGYVYFKLTTTKPWLYWVICAALVLFSIAVISQNDMLLVPALAGFYASIAIFFFQCYQAAKTFGRGIGFAIGLAILNPVFVLLLGLNMKQYEEGDMDDIEAASAENARIGFLKWKAWDDGIGVHGGMMTGDEFWASMNGTGGRTFHDIAIDAVLDDTLILDPDTIVVPVAADLALLGGSVTGRIMKPRQVGPQTTWREARYGYAYLPVESLKAMRSKWNKDAAVRGAAGYAAGYATVSIAQKLFKK